ncbi:ATP-binding protein [Saccharospirillum mangrovi]|uniref:ATP-binding protein n=1 Tax=Saccharospirillum mangrovi TaxID=2161747 RepID=UPI000D3C1025|nr:ATP-binding protein [Saccharospirillum mangrovi]
MPAEVNRPSYSLRRRLLGSATAVLLIFLGITGLALDRAVERSLVSGQSERLFLRVLNLLAESELNGNDFWLPTYLAEERYNSPESGLVALVLNEQRQLVWESLSSQWFEQSDWVLAQPNVAPGKEEFGNVGGYVYERYAVLWEGTDGETPRFEFWVLEDASPLQRSLQTFRSQLWGGLGAVTLVLLLTLWLVARWGLAPLHQVAMHLRKIRSGEARRLEGRYPRELTPLTDNLNRLLEAEQGQRDRYRQAMADLAHSLKTPLAVMRTLEPGDVDELNEQISRMDQIVRYQLQRAVTEARSGPVLGQRADLGEALARVGRALEKAYAAQDKVLDLPDAGDWSVAMDPNDLLEVLGNLLENGFKYSRSVISVAVTRDSENADAWCLDIDDDGPGISPAERERVLGRHQRLDTLQPGQGIGLAMVRDILASYGLVLQIDTSPFGGARFRLLLPSA